MIFDYGMVSALLAAAAGCLIYLWGERNGRRECLDRVSGAADEILERHDAERAAPEPLRLEYILESANGKAMRGGSVTFYQFTFADWSQASVHKEITAAIEVENPGWTVIGYHVLPNNGEEACG